MRKFHRRRDLKEQQPECVINEYVEFDKKLKQKIKWNNYAVLTLELRFSLTLSHITRNVGD